MEKDTINNVTTNAAKDVTEGAAEGATADNANKDVAANVAEGAITSVTESAAEGATADTAKGATTGTTIKTMSARMRRARSCAIASTVIAILMILSLIGMTVLSVDLLDEISADPDVINNAGIDFSGLGSMFAGNGVTPATASMLLMALFAMFFGFGAILNLVPLMASVRVIRAAGKPNDKRSTYIMTAIGAAVSFPTSNPVNGILLVIISYNLVHDYVDTVGESVAYKDGKRLGVMRFMEIMCVIDLVSTIAVLIFVQKTDFSFYNAAFWIEFIKLIMESVTLWFIWNRKQHGREVIMGMVGFYLVAYLVVAFASGDTVMQVNFVINSIIPIMLLIYFGAAPRPRAIFTEPFRIESREKQLAEDEKLWNPKSWRFWRNLLLYFCIFSVIGHWMEWCVCWVIRIACEHGITWLGTYDPNSGIWTNMLNPFFVYGLALVLIGILLFPMRNLFYRKIQNRWGALAAEFVFNFVLIAALELAIGLISNTPRDPVTGKLPLWDYSKMPLNFFDGQICLLNTTFFTVMATIFTNIVYPNLEKAFAKIPDDVMNVLTVVVLVFFALVVVMYVNIAGDAAFITHLDFS